MDAIFKATDPDSIEMEMTIKMSLGEWRKLEKQLDNEYPAWTLGKKIQSMVYIAHEHFKPE